MSAIERTDYQREPAADKLAALRDFFVYAKDSSFDLSEKAGPTHVASFSDLLFSRAPLSYLNSSSFESLKQVAVNVLRFFDGYLTGDKTYAIRVETVRGSERAGTGQTVIMIAIEDRPFIVDSVLEVVRYAGLAVHLLLDPIFRDADSRRFCVLYLETTAVCDDSKVKSLESQLTSMISDLCLAVEDFTAMVVRAETAARLLEGSSVPASTASEVKRFLHWLCDDNFVFLGYREWKTAFNSSSPEPLRAADLGLFRSKSQTLRESLEQVTLDAAFARSTDEPITVCKTLVVSPIHRFTRMEFVGICTQSPANGECMIQGFVGLFTSKSAAQEASTVPIIRKKVEQLVELDQRIPHARDYKDIVSFIDSTPKTFLMELSVESIRRDIDLAFSARHEDRVRISIQIEPVHRSGVVMVLIPAKRFYSRAVTDVQKIIESHFELPESSCEHRLVMGEDGLARVYFDIPPSGRNISTDDIEILEGNVSEITQRWEDRLEKAIFIAWGASDGAPILQYYQTAFPDDYRATYSPEDAVRDIRFMELLSADNPLELCSVQSTRSDLPHLFDLRLYKFGDPLTLSAILPYLENAGLEIIQETSTHLSVRDRISIHNFLVRSKSGSQVSTKVLDSFFVPGLKKVISGLADNDGLNSLLLEPGLDLSRIAVIRVIKHYLWQIKAVSTPNTMMMAIKQNPVLAGVLVQFFETKFDPTRFIDAQEQRLAKLDALRKEFRDALKSVSDISHDRILRSFLNVAEATVRTNYFRSQDNFSLALKIECKQITDMPKPRPLYEIFVTAPTFEAVHLRGGKVARGGIRWSERPEDFRTEVLGLMKTQLVKNSIIIPTGAKGGFVVKFANPSPDQVRACYEQFVDTLLQITDNRIDDKIVHPERCVIYDDSDPYLVVAADKGTAKFSDVANNIAVNKFHFWLGDAFASGGSYGYDHKELGITAKGAWETAQRHFREIGIDVDSQEFTVVGIGDMSGDVFGNGLLLSSNAKLIAAFDHRHIFIDPNPDTKLSFEERQRLFELPRSQWTDYNRAVISSGGGIYARTEKEITLSTDARAALGIEADTISGQELIRCILRAPVDLLWNGGIGTYIKASTESHLQAGDRSNDDVRIDAKEVRAKVIAEGGNLGLTQLARIEYSKTGGHCNTDAVDNSGGVDCSDYEVNLKILLQAPMRRGELTFEQRNALLKSLSPEVVRKVTSRNRAQSKVISLGIKRSRRNLDYYRGLIALLEVEGLLDRAGEFLPDDESLTRRGSLKLGITRPELAILIAYVKIWLTRTVHDSSLPEEPFAERFLLSYFPRAVVDRFRGDAKAHPLAREIVSKQIANLLVERVGAPFVYRIAEETGAKQSDIIAAFLAADVILHAAGLARSLEAMDRAQSTDAYLNALLGINRALDAMTRWLLERKSPYLTWTETVERYQQPVALLLSKTDSLFEGVELRRFEEAYNQCVLNGFPPDIARSASGVIYSAVYLDVAEISAKQSVDVLQVGRLYAHLISEFQVSRLLEQTTEIEPADRWEALALRTITAQLRDSVATITEAIIKETGSPGVDNANAFLAERREPVQRFRNSLREFQGRSLTVPALLVMSNQLIAIAR